jgi:hypothetical protein
MGTHRCLIRVDQRGNVNVRETHTFGTCHEFFINNLYTASRSQRAMRFDNVLKLIQKPL